MWGSLIRGVGGVLGGLTLTARTKTQTKSETGAWFWFRRAAAQGRSLLRGTATKRLRETARAFRDLPQTHAVLGHQKAGFWGLGRISEDRGPIVVETEQSHFCSPAPGTAGHTGIRGISRDSCADSTSV